MKLHAFGNTTLRVSEIGFGGSRIGGVFAGRQGAHDALSALGKALDAGINFFDTADMYAQGESETLMGTAFRNRREEVILATKGGFCLPGRRSLIARIKPLVRPVVQALGLKRARLPAGISGALSQNFTREYLVAALEASLKRLQMDHVDLYQLHSPSAEFMQTGAFGDALDTLERLKTQGKLRFYGIATEIPEDAPFCLDAPGISSVQLGFGLLDLQALDQGTISRAKERGLAVIARGCFGGGLLKDGLQGEALKEATPKWPRIESLRALCNGMNRPVLDTAFQFCRGTPGVSVTLLGMRTETHLRENLRYLDGRPLDSNEYAALRA